MNSKQGQKPEPKDTIPARSGAIRHRLVSSHNLSIPVGWCQCGCGEKTNISQHNHKARGVRKGDYYRYISKHNSSSKKPRYEISDSGCWLWMRSLDTKGYGVTQKDGVRRKAHRVVYEEMRCPIPIGLHLDHLCRIRSCVNPEHLEPVTCKENIRRGHAARIINLAGGSPAPYRRP